MRKLWLFGLVFLLMIASASAITYDMNTQCYPGAPGIFGFLSSEAGNCPPYIIDWQINPCVDGGKLEKGTPFDLWINASACDTTGYGYGSYNVNPISMTTLVSDPWCDNVSIQAIIYYDGLNCRQESSWQTVMTYEGYTFSSTDFENETGTGTGFFCTTTAPKEIVINVKNAVNDTYAWDTTTIHFEVADVTNGTYYGDCVSYMGAYSTQQQAAITSNAITKAFGSFGIYTSTFLYLLLMLGVGIAMFLTLRGRNGKSLGIAATMVVEVLLMFIGTWIGALHWVFIVIFFVAALVIIARKVREWLI